MCWSSCCPALLHCGQTTHTLCLLTIPVTSSLTLAHDITQAQEETCWVGGPGDSNSAREKFPTPATACFYPNAWWECSFRIFLQGWVIQWGESVAFHCWGLDAFPGSTSHCPWEALQHAQTTPLLSPYEEAAATPSHLGLPMPSASGREGGRDWRRKGSLLPAHYLSLVIS